MKQAFDSIAEKYDDFVLSVDKDRLFSNMVRELLRFPLNSTILDLGIGTGYMGIFLAKVFKDCIKEFICLETSEKMLDIAKKNINNQGLHDLFVFINRGIEEYQSDKKFDAVLSFGIMGTGALRFVVNQKRVIKKCSTLLKKNGCLLIQDIRLPDDPDSYQHKILTTIYPHLTEKKTIIQNMKEVGFRNINAVDLNVQPTNFESFIRLRQSLMNSSSTELRKKVETVIEKAKKDGTFRPHPESVRLFFITGKKKNHD